MTARIVRAERENALILGALTMQADLEYGGVHRAGFVDEFADAWLADYDHLPTWMAFGADGSAIGFVMTSWVRKMPSLCRPATGWLYVKTVFVTPNARRNGVAGRLLSEMIAWGDRHAIELYQLSSEPKARSLYERLGFCAPDEKLMIRRAGVDLPTG